MKRLRFDCRGCGCSGLPDWLLKRIFGRKWDCIRLVCCEHDQAYYEIEMMAAAGASVAELRAYKDWADLVVLRGGLERIHHSRLGRWFAGLVIGGGNSALEAL